MIRYILPGVAILSLSLSLSFDVNAQNLNLGSGNYIMLHSPTDENWKFGKDNSHHINVIGYGFDDRRFRVIDGSSGNEHFNVNLLNGKVGIGITAPGAKLHVVSGTANTGDNTAVFAAPAIGSISSHIHWGPTGDWYIRSAQSSGKVILQDTGGKVGVGAIPTHTLTVQSQVSGTDVQANIFNPANQNGAVAGIRFHTGSSWNVMLRTRQDNAWLELTNSAGSVTHYWNGGDYFATGKIAIGTTDTPGDHRLYVNGSTLTTEVNVKLKSEWPDYVFKSHYQLTPLSELKNYLNTYGHLPEIPTEKEVKENGLNLGEMNALLLKKVEELTLHLIEQNQKWEKQQKQLEEQQKEIERLKTKQGN